MVGQAGRQPKTRTREPLENNHGALCARIRNESRQVVGLGGLFGLALAVGCAEPTGPQARSLAGPIDLAAFEVCATRQKLAWSFEDSSVCGANTRAIWAFVTNAQHGDIGILNLTATESSNYNVDTDPFTPGYTRIPVGGVLGDAARSTSGEFLYFIRVDDTGVPSLDRLEVRNWAAGTLRQLLPAPASSLVWWSAPEGEGTLDGFLLATIPSLGKVAYLAVDESAPFGALDPSDVPLLPIGGVPSQVLVTSAAGETSAKLYVAQQADAWVASVDWDACVRAAACPPEGDGSEAAECSDARAACQAIRAIPLGPACGDGLDNDGDGLIDGLDPGCVARNGDDESAEIVATARCNNGLDDDGDGYLDYPDDPGCASPFDDTEWSELPPCVDGFDNDGDGFVDGDDVDCSSDEATEGTVGCGGAQELACPDDLVPLPVACGDGLDNDGDSLVDDADPQCLTRTDASESGASADAFTRLAATEDGSLVYASHAGRQELFVIQTATDTLTDANYRPSPLGNPLLSHEGRRGIVLPRAAMAITFAPSVVTLEDGRSENTRSAFVTTTAGELLIVDALVADQEYHLLRASSAQQNTATRPQVFTNGTEVEQSFRPAQGFPHLGAFVEDRANNLFNGVEISQESRVVRGETWQLEHQGALPLSRRSSGRMLGWQEGADGTPQAVFHDSLADFCAVGAEPGDTLVIYPGFRLDCEDPAQGGRWRGDRLEMRISSVSADTLVLSRADLRAHCPDVVDAATLSTLADAGGVGITIPTAQERYDSNLADTESGDTCTPGPLPTASCLGGALEYEIAAPPGIYVVTGSRTGHLHGWVNDNGTCVEKPIDPRVRGRATESVPSDVPPELCGQYPLDDSYFAAESPFENFSFRATVRPGCLPPSETLLGEPIAARFVPTRRGTALRFTLRSGYASFARVVNSSVPNRLRYTGLNGMLYVIDPGAGTVSAVDPVDPARTNLPRFF